MHRIHVELIDTDDIRHSVNQIWFLDMLVFGIVGFLAGSFAIPVLAALAFFLGVLLFMKSSRTVAVLLVGTATVLWGFSAYWLKAVFSDSKEAPSWLLILGIAGVSLFLHLRSAKNLAPDGMSSWFKPADKLGYWKVGAVAFVLVALIVSGAQAISRGERIKQEHVIGFRDTQSRVNSGISGLLSGGSKRAVLGMLKLGDDLILNIVDEQGRASVLRLQPAESTDPDHYYISLRDTKSEFDQHSGFNGYGNFISGKLQLQVYWINLKDKDIDGQTEHLWLKWSLADSIYRNQDGPWNGHPLGIFRISNNP